MDLAILYDGRALTFDLGTLGADLATEDGLRAAVLVSLFTDRRAEADDPLPGAPNSADRRATSWRAGIQSIPGHNRRGWWADAWPEVDGDRIGSRLWLLAREKQTADVLQRAQVYSEEALAWLIEDGVALAVSVTAEWVADAHGRASAAGGRMPGAATGVLGLHVALRLADGGRFDDVFNYQLEAA